MNIKNRLEIIEAKMNPTPEKSLIIRISRAGRAETPTAWRHHTTGEIFHHDSDTSHLKGVNLMMAVY
jgi:hypothetical protein